MKKLILILLLAASYKAYSQSAIQLASPSTRYAASDTISCHFLECVNDSTFKWESGYVVRDYGLIKFGRVSVVTDYLPVTSGIVTSPLFYSDHTPIKNYAIRVIFKDARQN